MPSVRCGIYDQIVRRGEHRAIEDDFQCAVSAVFFIERQIVAKNYKFPFYAMQLLDDFGQVDQFLAFDFD